MNSTRLGFVAIAIMILAVADYGSACVVDIDIEHCVCSSPEQEEIIESNPGSFGQIYDSLIDGEHCSRVALVVRATGGAPHAFGTIKITQSGNSVTFWDSETGGNQVGNGSVEVPYNPLNPPDPPTWYGYYGTILTITLWVDAESTGVTTLTATWDGIEDQIEPDEDTKLVDGAKVTFISVDLLAAYASQAAEETLGAPVGLNDDNDNGNEYEATEGEHRECEPVWDKDEIDTVEGEDDLMQLTASLDTPGRTEPAQISVVTGDGTTIRLWKYSNKGTENDLVHYGNTTGGNFYVEGIALGTGVITLSWQIVIDPEAPPVGFADSVVPRVVALQITQGGTPRVINAYNTNTRFEVAGGADTGCTYTWDLDGDGNSTDPFEQATTRVRDNITYGPNADGAANVQLQRNLANHRKTYAVSVSLTGGLALSKTIRVALDQYFGTALTATADAVGAVTVTAGGAGYTSAPTVTFTGGGGNGASATATVTTDIVSSVTVTAGGSGYTSAPTVTLTGGGGTGATATATVAGPVTSINVTNGGTGYTSAPAVTLTGGGGSGATATATVQGGAVTQITVTAGGSGYTSAPTVTLTGGGGTGATATAVVTTDIVSAITVTAGGSGYTSAPTVTLAGGGGNGATATATVTGPVTAVTLTARGSGYTAAPTVTLTGGGGNGATATAPINIAAGRDNEVATVFANWNNTNPITFDNTHAAGNFSQGWFQTAYGAADYQLRVINNGNRIQYAAQGQGYAGEVTNGGTGNGVEIYVVRMRAPIWTNGIMREGMIAVANHEKKHCEQDRQAKTNNPADNIYRRLDALYGGVTQAGYVAFAEAEAWQTMLADNALGWRFHLNEGVATLYWFRLYYMDAVGRQIAMTEGARKTAAREFLQTLYNSLPDAFAEMKKPASYGYDFSIRPPP